MPPKASNSVFPRNSWSVDGVFNLAKHKEHRALGFIHLHGSSVGEGDTRLAVVAKFLSTLSALLLIFLGGDIDLLSTGCAGLGDVDIVATLREQ